MAPIVLQHLMDFEKIQGQHIRVCPTLSQDAYQAISIEHEALSDAYDPEETLIEVSCLYIHLGQISQIDIPHFMNIRFRNYCYCELTFIRSFLVTVENYTHSGAGGRRGLHHSPASTTISVSPYSLF
jgi:hypothetical protein